MSALDSGNPSDLVLNASPVTGGTVAWSDVSQDQILWMTPAANLATLTLTLPSEANSRIGQRCLVGSSKAVAILSVTGATTIYNALNVLNAGDSFLLRKLAPNTWAKSL